MIKKLFFLCFAALLAGHVMAQEPSEGRPQRSPEEEALMQTTRLVRELEITDSVRIDTIYRMHLKYAKLRQKGLTRSENLQRLQAIYEELSHLLTPEEFERFMNHPVESPRRPRGATNVRAKSKPAPPSEPQ